MQKQQLHVVRRQFIPDGVGGCVVELTIENLKNAPRMVEVSFTAVSYTHLRSEEIREGFNPSLLNFLIAFSYRVYSC